MSRVTVYTGLSSLLNVDEPTDEVDPLELPIKDEPGSPLRDGLLDMPEAAYQLLEFAMGGEVVAISDPTIDPLESSSESTSITETASSTLNSPELPNPPITTFANTITNIIDSSNDSSTQPVTQSENQCPINNSNPNSQAVTKCRWLDGLGSTIPSTPPPLAPTPPIAPSPASVAPKKYSCKICSYPFDDELGVKRHMDAYGTAGSRNKRLACHICRKKVNTPGQLLIHRNTSHRYMDWNNLPFQCEYCLLQFPLDKWLQVHVTHYHGTSKMLKQLKASDTSRRVDRSRKKGLGRGWRKGKRGKLTRKLEHTTSEATQEPGVPESYRNVRKRRRDELLDVEPHPDVAGETAAASESSQLRAVPCSCTKLSRPSTKSKPSLQIHSPTEDESALSRSAPKLVKVEPLSPSQLHSPTEIAPLLRSQVPYSEGLQTPLGSDLSSAESVASILRSSRIGSPSLQMTSLLQAKNAIPGVPETQSSSTTHRNTRKPNPNVQTHVPNQMTPSRSPKKSSNFKSLSSVHRKSKTSGGFVKIYSVPNKADFPEASAVALRSDTLAGIQGDTGKTTPFGRVHDPPDDVESAPSSSSVLRHMLETTQRDIFQTLKSAAKPEKPIARCSPEAKLRKRSLDLDASPAMRHETRKISLLKQRYKCRECYVALDPIDSTQLPIVQSDDCKNEEASKIDVQLRNLELALKKLEEPDWTSDGPAMPEPSSQETKSKNELYRSSLCRTRFTTKQRLINHYLCFHTYSNSGKCGVCGIRCGNTRRLRVHLSVHCIQIKKSKEDRSPIDIKGPCDKYKKKYSCQDCHRRFWLASCLEQHREHCRYRKRAAETSQEESTIDDSHNDMDSAQLQDVSDDEIPVRRKSPRKLTTKFYAEDGLAASVFTKPDLIVSTKPAEPLSMNPQSTLQDWHRWFTQESRLRITAYPCHICDMNCQSAGNLAKHLKQFVTTSPVHCERCETLFPSKGLLVSHMKMAHSPDVATYEFHCPVCGQGFRQRKYLRPHLLHIHSDQMERGTIKDCHNSTEKEAVGEQKEPDPIYEMKAFDEDDFNCQAVEAGDPANIEFNCAICDDKFTSMLELKDHKITHSPVDYDHEEDFEVDSKSVLSEDTKSHHSYGTNAMLLDSDVQHKAPPKETDLIPVNDICKQQESAASDTALASFIPEETPADAFYPSYSISKDIASDFSIANTFSVELDEYERLANNQCQDHDNANAVTEPSAGSDAPETCLYLCNVCQLAFTCIKTLENHQIRYSNVGDYVCEFCGRRFQWSRTFRRHITRHNRKTADTTPLYYCNDCDEAFSSKNLRLMHFAHIHNDPHLETLEPDDKTSGNNDLSQDSSGKSEGFYAANAGNSGKAYIEQVDLTEDDKERREEGKKTYALSKTLHPLPPKVKLATPTVKGPTEPGRDCKWPIVCNICKLQCVNVHALVNHFETVHDIRLSNQGTTVNKVVKLGEHDRSKKYVALNNKLKVAPAVFHYCQICRIQFSNESSYVTHQANAHPKKPCYAKDRSPPKQSNWNLSYTISGNSPNRVIVGSTVEAQSAGGVSIETSFLNVGNDAAGSASTATDSDKEMVKKRSSDKVVLSKINIQDRHGRQYRIVGGKKPQNIQIINLPKKDFMKLTRQIEG